MHKLILLVILQIPILLHAQRLGFSSFSPFGGNNSEANHNMYGNMGEPIVNTECHDTLNIHNGLFNNLEAAKFPNSYIQVLFFIDENENGVKESDEVYINAGSVVINEEQIFKNFSTNGILLTAVSGNYIVEFDSSSLPEWNLTTDDYFELELNDDESYVVEFGFKPDFTSSNSFPCMSGGNLRCSSKVYYNLMVFNAGNQIETGTIWLQIDERIDSIFFDIEPDIVINKHLVGYDFVVTPYEKIYFPYCLKAPEVSKDENPPGTLFKSFSYINTSNGYREYCFNQELRCSFDPNDKLINPDRPDSLALLDQALIYTLRFQNTGNDYAEDVVVRDTMSPLLDMSTFNLIETSHPNDLEVIIDRDDPHIVAFSFQNIYLQDSTTNLEASNGHVMYSIEPFEDIEEYSLIENTGYIYFDFNPAVVTNTTMSTMVEEYPIVSVYDFDPKLEVNINPNPSSHLIQLSQRVDHVQLISIEGKYLKSFYNTEDLDISQVNPGSYFLDIELNGNSIRKKVIITK